MNQDLQERAKQGDPEAIAIICELCQALNVLQTRVVNSINIVSYKKAHNNLKIDVFSKQEVDKQVKKDYKASEVQKRLRLSIRNSIESNTVELYNVFVPYSIAQNGGSIQVILKSGHSIDAQIPKNAQNGTQLKLKNHEFNGRTILLVLHILQAEKFNIDDKIHKIINNAPIQLNTKRRCREVYFNLKEGQSVSDWDALNILDVMVESSRSKELTKNRYQIASENSRICAIQDCIDMALEASNLNEIDRKVLQAVFQFLKSGEPIYEFERLNQLDVIVRSSTLHQSLKELYAVTSTKSKALAVDSAIMGLLYSACDSQDTLEQLKSVYSQIREGDREFKKTNPKDKQALEILDTIVFQSDLPTEYKVIYLVAHMRATQSGDKEEIENIESSVDASEAVNKLRKAVERASKIGSTTTTVMSSVGVKAGTGVTIASLQGAAATNATLAALGGGSVAAGGLGMLGGLTVATGGAALMGAAAFVSIAAMSNMDSRDKVNLGIAAVGGTLTSAATVGTAWTLVSTFGVAGTGTAIGTLSGAAAYSATMAALGGLGVMTGGAALIAGGAGLAIWQLLKKTKDNPVRIIKLLEAKMYTISEEISHPVLSQIEHHLSDFKDVSIAPNIPLDRLIDEIADMGGLGKTEKVFACLDLKLLGIKQGSILLTDSRILWKEMWDSPKSRLYQDWKYYKESIPQLGEEQADGALKRFLDRVSNL